MAIISKEMSLIELCRLLNVTPSWVNKTIKELDLPRSGRGNLRMFTRQDYFIFRNIKVLLLCDISWSFIKELRKDEQLLIKEFKKFITETEQEAKDGKCTLTSGPMYISLMLSPDIECSFSIIKYKTEEKSWDAWGYFREYTDPNPTIPSPWQHEKDISVELKKVIELLTGFSNTHFYTYYTF